MLVPNIFSYSALAYHKYDVDIEEFEQQNNIFHTKDKKWEDELQKNLKEAEKGINENNEAFEKGESTFEQQLYRESVLPKKEFEKEREGLLPLATPKSRFYPDEKGMGLILQPESERFGPENDAALAEIDRIIASDRKKTPKKYNAVKLGK